MACDVDFTNRNNRLNVKSLLNRKSLTSLFKSDIVDCHDIAMFAVDVATLICAWARLIQRNEKMCLKAYVNPRSAGIFDRTYRAGGGGGGESAPLPA